MRPNTTITRPGLEGEKLAQQAGGLSGRPLKTLSTSVIRRLYAHLRGQIPIIGVGGIETTDDAWEKLVAGADLVQIYSVLIYERSGRGAENYRGTGGGKTSASGAATLTEAIVQGAWY